MLYVYKQETKGKNIFGANASILQEATWGKGGLLYYFGFLVYIVTVDLDGQRWLIEG